MLIRFTDRGFKIVRVPVQELAWFQASLTAKTMLLMTLGITSTVLALAGVSYFNIKFRLEQQTQKRLEQYIIERGQRESLTFQAIEKNHAQLKQEALSRLNAVRTLDLQPRFDQLFQQKSDGTLRTSRHLYEGELQERGRVIRGLTGMIRKESKLDADRYRQFAIAFDLLSEYVPAWQHKSEQFYIFTPDGSSLGIGNSSWGLEVAADYPFEQQEWVYASHQKHNPQRKSIWTSPYYDSVPQDYMITCVTPIDTNGQHILSIGTDIRVGALIKNSIQDRLEGTYNIILRADGQLIAHPRLMEKLKTSQGAIHVQTLKNAHLQNIFQQVTSADRKPQVLTTDQDLLAFTRIAGPDWYFITVYPKHLLNSDILTVIQHIVKISIVTLIVEIALLLFVLRKQIMIPLQQLLSATRRLTSGDFSVHLDTTRQDELGQLASAFNDMTVRLNHSFTELEAANAQLENRVAQRTVELENALRNLQQTQAQMLQSEKMSALGQMVAGIAHEINNSVNFIHGNLPYMNHYVRDLLKVVQIYQQHCPNPPSSVQQDLDEID